MDRIKNLLRAFLGVPLTIVSFLFIANFIYKSRNEVLPNLANFNVPGVSVGILLLGLFFILRSIAWRQIMAKEGFLMPFAQSAYLLAASELKRYIPGSILAFLSRIDNFGKFKIPTKAVLRMIVVENIIFVLTSFLVSIPALFYIASKNNIDQNILYIVLSIALIGLLIAYFTVKFSKIIREALRYSDSFFFMVLAWISFGVGNYIIFSSFYFFDPTNIVRISSLAVLSWLIGYIVVIAPLGLGAREAFLTYALSLLSPVGLAAALAIIGRVCFTLAELIFLGLAFILNKSFKTFPKIESSMVVLWTGILSYIFYFTYYSFEKYNSFFMGRFDLGNMDQTVWNTLHGRIFELTDPNGVSTVSRLSFHSDFILIFLAPFYILWEDPRMLLLIQTVVIAFGAYFVYKISEQVLGQKQISLVFAISYLLNPFIQKQNLFDFHAVTLATTFLLAAFYLLLKKSIPE